MGSPSRRIHRRSWLLSMATATALAAIWAASGCGPTPKPVRNTVQPDAALVPSPPMGKIEVDCEPGEAQVVVDDQPRGTADEIARGGGMELPQGHHRIEDRAADVLEVDVDPVGTGRAQIRRETSRLVVDAGIESELFDHVLALHRSAGDTHGATALDPGDLSDGGSDRAAGGGDHHGLPGLRLSHPQQAEVGGEAGHPQHADGRR